MRGLSFPSSPTRRRAVAFVLTLIIEAIFLLAFLVPFRTPDKPKETSLVTMALRAATQPAASRKAAKAQTKAAKTAPDKPPPPRPETPPSPESPYIKLSREDFAAGDISRLPSHKGEGDTGKKTAGSTYGPGEGPNGAPLYNAEWVVEPTNGELSPYFKKEMLPESWWAEIICQTAPNNRVENCRSRKESHPGNGLSNSLRQAAWQFRVYPPRRGGTPMIGAWVVVHLDWNQKFERY